MSQPRLDPPPAGAPVVAVLAGDPTIGAAASAGAAALGWRIIVISAGLRERFSRPVVRGGGLDLVAMLVDLHPALLMIELDAPTPGWQRIVTAAKTDPATRRIPILGIGSDEPAFQTTALAAGCDAVMTAESFSASAVDTLRRAARIDDAAELARQSALPLPEAARRAIAEFNAGAYFEQHELFEEIWRAEPGPVRQLYQGLLLIGVAFLQIQRRNETGARKTFQRARQYLEALPDVCQGVDVARFRTEAEAARRELERLGPERIDQFDPAYFCRIHLVN